MNILKFFRTQINTIIAVLLFGICLESASAVQQQRGLAQINPAQAQQFQLQAQQPLLQFRLPTLPPGKVAGRRERLSRKELLLNREELEQEAYGRLFDAVSCPDCSVEEIRKIVEASRVHPLIRKDLLDLGLLSRSLPNEHKVAYLLSQGAFSNATDEDKSNMLISAIYNGHIPSAKILVRFGANIDENKKNDLLRFFINIPAKDLDKEKRKEGVRFLVQMGADVNHVDAIMKQTPLMEAITSEAKDPNMVSLFISLGADPYFVDANGETALHIAVRSQLPDMVLAILRAIAPPLSTLTLPSLGDLKMLMGSSGFESQEAFEYAQEKEFAYFEPIAGWDPSIPLASMELGTGIGEVAKPQKSLERLQAEFEKQGFGGEEARRMAHETYAHPSNWPQEYTEMPHFLEFVNRKSKVSDTALHLSADFVFNESGKAILNLLLAVGADPNIKSIAGFTVAHRLVQSANIALSSDLANQNETVQIFLFAIEALRNHGADFAIRDIFGRTPLEFLSQEVQDQFPDLTRLLRRLSNPSPVAALAA